MRTEIKKQTKRGPERTFTRREREQQKEKKKETTINDKLSIKYHHVQHHEKKNMVVFFMIGRDNIVDHGDTPKNINAPHVLSTL